jgi:hypothetical protein
MTVQNSKMPFLKLFPTIRKTGFVFAAAIVAACGSSSESSVPQLHLACQTVECECRDEKTALFKDRKTTEIVWRQNGDATCPRGFILERVEIDFLGRRR